MNRRIITVSREFGSGGRELGKKLSEILNIEYLDNKIVEAVAKETELDPSYISKSFDSGAFNYLPTSANSLSYISAAAGSAMLIAKQHNIIKQLVKDKDFVIIGRGADAILSEYKPFKIFVYADMPSKIARCKSRMSEDEKLTDKELERKIKTVDKNRKKTHDLYAPYVWGDKAGYNLCVNTTGLNIDEIAPLIARYIEKYFENNN